DDLPGVVCQQPNLPDAEIDENLSADAIVPQVRRVAEPAVGLDGVDLFLLLELVGAELGEQADAASFLTHVQDHALARLADLLQGTVELRAALAEQAVEGIAGQALAVDANQHRVGLHGDAAARFDADAAAAEGQARLRVHQRRV